VVPAVNLGEILMIGYVVAFFMFLVFVQPAIAGYRERFQKEFLTQPWSGEQLEEDVCIECHAMDIMKPGYRNILEQWKMSWHSQNNVSCHGCHGGDPKDPALSMSHQRGFVGSPKYSDIPEFCGKCHVGIMKNYLESGHGKALKVSGKGPNCVTCHGSHNIQKASIEIIDEKLCTRCHSYERARIMKQAIFFTERKILDLDDKLRKLRHEGVFTEDVEKSVFSTHAEFRTLFHTIDVSLVKERTDEFMKRLENIEKDIKGTFNELRFRKSFSAFLMLVFAGIVIVLFLLLKAEKD
jgi:nitrate/TMAO reductase-like tetraheme cytochrome c subunit